MRYSFDVAAAEGESPYFGVMEAEFDDAEALGAAMASPEGLAVVADIPNYATGGRPELPRSGCAIAVASISARVLEQMDHPVTVSNTRSEPWRLSLRRSQGCATSRSASMYDTRSRGNAGSWWAYGSVSGGIRYPGWGREVARGSGLLFAGESRRHCVLVRLDLARVRDRIPLQRVDQFGRTSEVCPGVVP
jgi:hypothetical protein